MTSSDKNVPNALDCWPALERTLRGRQLAIFLDYDGTIVPIAERPDLARLDDTQRAELQQLATTWPTFVLSGRAWDDVCRLLDMPAIQCVGAHGLDGGPDTPPELVKQLTDIPRTIERAANELSLRLANVPNLIIENKTVALAVHYRRVAPNFIPDVEIALTETAARWPALITTTGKMVFELRPDLDWNKGSALLWLLSSHAVGTAAFPVFIGDDLTDEDALEAVAGRGIGVVVEGRRPTAAHYSVRDVAEVYELLNRIRALRAFSEPPGGLGEGPV